jgi:hypothetical protein
MSYVTTILSLIEQGDRCENLGAGCRQPEMCRLASKTEGLQVHAAILSACDGAGNIDQRLRRLAIGYRRDDLIAQRVDGRHGIAIPEGDLRQGFETAAEKTRPPQPER